MLGGGIEKNENKVDALIREIYEELSTFIKKSNIKYFIIISFIHDQKKINRFFYVKGINFSEKNKIKLNEGQRYSFFKSKDF